MWTTVLPMKVKEAFMRLSNEKKTDIGQTIVLPKYTLGNIIEKKGKTCIFPQELTAYKYLILL